MSKTTDAVSLLARPAVESLGLILWDVEFLREGGRWVLRIVIDHPDGVNINHCEAVSRAIEPLLDEADPIEQSYVLQVSSAGIERQLKRPSDFEHFMGHKVELGLYAPLNGQKEWIGTLDAYDGEHITVEGTAYVMKQVAWVKLRADF